jgi:hypothetical protein
MSWGHRSVFVGIEGEGDVTVWVVPPRLKQPPPTTEHRGPVLAPDSQFYVTHVTQLAQFTLTCINSSFEGSILVKPAITSVLSRSNTL